MRQGRKKMAILLLLGLVFSSIFEGILLGVQKELSPAIKMAIFIPMWKVLTALALGSVLLSMGVDKKHFTVMMTVLGLITPIGVAIGMGIKAAHDDKITGTFAGLASGVFFYNICVDIVPTEFGRKEQRLARFFVLLFGVLLISILDLVNA